MPLALTVPPLILPGFAANPLLSPGSLDWLRGGQIVTRYLLLYCNNAGTNER